MGSLAMPGRLPSASSFEGLRISALGVVECALGAYSVTC
jgi:hypothetical protein